jgi:hypothetical protein
VIAQTEDGRTAFERAAKLAALNEGIRTMIEQRFTVEPQPQGRGFYVSDNADRCLVSGPYLCEHEATHECAMLRDNEGAKS